MEQKNKTGIWAMFIASVLVVAVLMSPASAAPLATESLGNMYTDGTADTASANGMGHVTTSPGWCTFTADCHNSNDVNNDGQGAIYELKVWDADGNCHTDSWETDRAGFHQLSVSFNSLGTGDAQYHLYCQTNTWNDEIQAQDTYTGDLDFE